MVYLKDYSFEYNAKQVDIFKGIAVCSDLTELNNFKEGAGFDIDEAYFYGVIASCKNAGTRFTLEVTAESYARELRNTQVSESNSFRQIDAVRLIKDHLLPDGWLFEYPAILDTNPRYISYILRNGNYLSHITTVLQLLGLDFNVSCSKAGNTYTKKVTAYFRNNFDGKEVTTVKENVNFANFSISIDYGKIATSIIVMGAESEQGINQVYMDAEIGNWDYAPHLSLIKDTQLKMPEMSTDAYYLWYYPASPANYQNGLFAAGDEVLIDTERMVVKSVWFLPATRVASYEQGSLSLANVASYLQNISSYDSTGVIVASIDLKPTVWNEALQKSVVASFRNVGAYGKDAQMHAVYDDILHLSATITTSSYLTFGKNLPATSGFIWFGSERLYYKDASSSSGYALSGMTRGVPSCAVASCQHCGTREALRPVGWSYGCPWGHSDISIDKYCPLMQEVEDVFGYTPAHVGDCPVCFDAESPCPILACPYVTNSTTGSINAGAFAQLCPKGLYPDQVSWGEKYPHHKDSIVLPASYYYSDGGVDTYEIYARDSLIHKYGYVPSQVSVKGVADADTLDKVAEGYLRLSSSSQMGKFTLFNFDPWTIPASFYPGDAIQVQVASNVRYDPGSQAWYPSQWFNYSSGTSCPGVASEWNEIPAGSGQWYQTSKTFVIQTTTKRQRSCPEVCFGTTVSDYGSTMDFLQEVKDTASQRHRNQDKATTVGTSTNGLAARVKNAKTGEIIWVRMVQ